MKNIGMFYSSRSEMVKAFREHANRCDPLLFNCHVKVNPRSETIEIGDTRWMYFTFIKDKDVHRIAGINFDAIFSEVVNPYCKRYMMTRFRPRFK